MIEKKSISTNDLIVKGRLSHKYIERQYGKKINSNSIISNPQLHQTYRKLKFLVEGREKRDLKIVLKEYEKLVAQLRMVLPNGGGSTALSRIDKNLYSKCLRIADWPLISDLAGVSASKNYWYWTDEDLIEACGKFKNFTDLKYGGGQLHRFIKGRELEGRVVVTHPSYATHMYIGIGAHVYSSQGELVLGNIIELSSLPNYWKRQYKTNLYRDGSNKPMTCDFFHTEAEVGVEVTMFNKNGRGSRGRFYQRRREAKKVAYKKNRFNVVFLDSDPFYTNGVIDSEAFARYCLDEFERNGIPISFDKNKLSRVAECKNVPISPEMAAEQVVDLLRDEFGVTRIADFHSGKSYVAKYINFHPKHDEIRKIIIKRSRERQRAASIKRWSRVSYSSIEEAMKFARKYSATSQPLWNSVVKKHKNELKRLNIPANVRSAYLRSGEWVSWTQFFSLARAEIMFEK